MSRTGGAWLKHAAGGLAGPVLAQAPGPGSGASEQDNPKAENARPVPASLCAPGVDCPAPRPKVESRLRMLESNRTPTSLPPGDEYPIVIVNQCEHPIRLWLAYYRDGGFHGGKAAWHLPGAKRMRLDLGGRDISPDNALVFFQALSEDDALEWRGAHHIRMEGEDFTMRRSTLDLVKGKWELVLTCL